MHNHNKLDSGDKKFTVQVSKPSQCKRVLSIEIPPDEVKKEEELVFKKLRYDLKIPGFRRGKIPEKYIWKNYGDVIHADAVQNLLPEVYERALSKENLTVIGSPKFDNVNAKRGETVKVDITVEVHPEIEIKDYRHIKVSVDRHEIGEKEVEEALRQLQERMATYKVVSRESNEKDLLIVDYGPAEKSGKVDGRHVNKNYPIDLSSRSILKEFREGLLGVSTGDEKDIEVSYPADFPEKDLAGTRKSFHVAVREIKEKVLPELNEEFVHQLGSDIKNLEDLKKRIKVDLIEEEEKRFNREVEERVIDEIIKKEPFEVPETMVENYIKSIIEEDKKRRPNVSSEEDREEEVRKLFHDSAIRVVKKYFIMEAIKKQENISVTEEELNTHIDEMAGSGERSKEIKQYFNLAQHRGKLEDELKDSKVLELLREGAST